MSELKELSVLREYGIPCKPEDMDAMVEAACISWFGEGWWSKSDARTKSGHRASMLLAILAALAARR